MEEKQNEDNLSEDIRLKISQSILNYVIPCFLFLGLISIVMVFLGPKEQYSRNVAGIVSIIGLSLALFLNRKGKIQWAIVCYMLVFGFSMLYSMVFNGGLNAPIFRAIPIYILCAVFFLRNRYAILFLILVIVFSILIQFFDSMGYLRSIEAASGWLMWTFSTIYSLMLFFLTYKGINLLRNYAKELEKKRALIEQDNKNFRQIINSVGDAVVAVCQDNSILSSNDTFDQWFSIDSLSNSAQLVDLLRFADEKDNPIAMSKVLLGYRPKGGLFLCRDEAVPVLLRVTALKDFKGHSNAKLITLRDISNETKLKGELSQSRKMEVVGQLSSGIAHDFNNMLSGILVAAEHMEADMEGENLEMLKVIQQAGERAASLTRQLLDFSRKGKLLSTEVDIHEIIIETRELLQRTLDKSIEMKVSLDAEYMKVVGDDSQIQNSLINLAINASHALDGHGEIKFSTHNIFLDEAYCKLSSLHIVPGDYICIEVEDNGIGMGQEVKDRIFEPFFTTKEHGQGTGLGLAAVYGMVESHRGTINVYSEEGVGTIFRIYLPCRNVTNSSDVHSEVDLPMGKGEHILLVDDEELIRVSTSVMLEALNYRVTMVSSGEEALKLMKSKKFDLVLLDMIMVGMNGREVFMKMQQGNVKAPPTILCSGFSKQKDLEEMLKHGLQGFLRKPFHRTELAHALEQVLVHKRS